MKDVKREMRIKKIKIKGCLSFYLKCLFESDFKNPLTSQRKYLKYSKLFRELRVRYPDWQDRIRYIVRYYRDLQEKFRHYKQFHYPFPHPEIFFMDDVFEYAKSLRDGGVAERKVEKVDYSPELLRVMEEKDIDDILRFIEEEGYGREEVYGTLEVLCRFRRGWGRKLREALDRYFGGS